MHEKKVTSDLGGGGSESRLIAKINHLQQIFTRQVEAAHLFFICILHIQVVFTFFDNLLQKKVCRLGVSPSLVSRWREGYSFWSS